MEQWIEDAKERAKYEAQEFVDNMKEVAFTLNLDEVWFIEEIVKNIHAIKDKAERSDECE